MMRSVRLPIASYFIPVVVSLVAVTSGCAKEHEAQPNAGGCASDKDCKGSRICLDSVCAAPAAAAAAVVPRPAPAAPAVAQSALMVNPPATHQRGIVRASPSADASAVTSLERGTSVNVLEVSGDGQWRRIQWTANGGGIGWMHRDVLSAAGAAPKPGRGGCTRENQFCLLDGTTAGICMNASGLFCATPMAITHHDGCGARQQGCTCSNTGHHGACDLGSLKEGLYCHCD